MNDSQESPLPDTRISEFAEIIAPKDGSASPVVVGGHAVIPQEGRNDVKHVRMMILCARAFIEEFAGYVSAGRLSERAMVNLLEETFEIVTSESADRSSARWGFDFSKVWPFEVLGNLTDGKVSRWLNHRFPSDAA